MTPNKRNGRATMCIGLGKEARRKPRKKGKVSGEWWKWEKKNGIARSDEHGKNILVTELRRSVPELGLFQLGGGKPAREARKERQRVKVAFQD